MSVYVFGQKKVLITRGITEKGKRVPFLHFCKSRKPNDIKKFTRPIGLWDRLFGTVFLFDGPESILALMTTLLHALETYPEESVKWVIDLTAMFEDLESDREWKEITPRPEPDPGGAPL